MSVDAYIRTAEFGMDVKAFMRSRAGLYLIGRANAEIAAAQDDLLTVEPTDAEAVRKLQNKAAVASCFLQWMGEAETEGEIAAQQAIAADSD